MVDTHTHLNLDPLSTKISQYYTQALDCKITHMMIVGTSIETSILALDIAKMYQAAHASVGIHPEDAVQLLDIKNSEIEASLEQLLPFATAIGECGLDYSSLHELQPSQAKINMNQQKRIFGIHIQLAKKWQKPLIIHCRNVRKEGEYPPLELNAYHDVIDSLQHFSVSDGVLPSFVLHCMSGPCEYLEKALELGGYISFAGNITYPSAKNLRQLLEHTPHQRLLLETDAPFLPPQDKRGKTNEPAFILYTYEFIARQLGLTNTDLTGIIESNAQHLFHW